MQQKKSGRATKVAQSVSRFFHKIYVNTYTRFWRLLGREYCVVTCFPKSKYRVNTPAQGFNRAVLAENIKEESRANYPIRRKVKPKQDPYWFYKAMLEADKIEVPESFK